MPKTTTLSKSSTSAAHILKNLSPKIPSSILNSAQGLAIFSTLRGGMWLGGAAGSGVLIARLPDGRWSGPSAFSVGSGSAGLVLGVDYLECVAVLNTPQAVRAYAGEKSGVDIGAGLSVAAGPLSGSMGDGGSESDKKEVYMYTRSKGLYGGLTVDGTIVRVKKEANEEFYGEKGITADRIIKGDVKDGNDPGVWPRGADELLTLVRKVAGGQ